jgi:hypothetical protein
MSVNPLKSFRSQIKTDELHIPLVALIFTKAGVYKGFSNSLKPLKLPEQGEYMFRRRCLSSNKTGNF